VVDDATWDEPPGSRTRAVPSSRAAIVTSVAYAAVGLVVVRRLPRPVRPLGDVALAATAPLVAELLTRLGL